MIIKEDPTVIDEPNDTFYYLQSEYHQNFSTVDGEAYFRREQIKKVARVNSISLSKQKKWSCTSRSK